jgi:hypothetical protein
MRNLRPYITLLILLAIAGCVQTDPRSTQIAVPPAAQGEKIGGDGGGGSGM